MPEGRSYEPELMDNLESGGKEMERTLDELESINYWLGGHTTVLNGLEKFLKKAGKLREPVSIVDLGCGGGDMLRILSDWSKRKGINTELIGVDANEFIIDYAQRRVDGRLDISFRKMDIFSPEFATQKFDIVILSLVCHHFDDEQLVKLFSQLKRQANLGVIVNDLHRHRLAYHSIKYITKALSRSEMIRNDAPLSVKRAFKKQELEKLLHDAGINDYSLRWMWAFRWQLIF